MANIAMFEMGKTISIVLQPGKYFLKFCEFFPMLFCRVFVVVCRVGQNIKYEESC